MEDKTFVQVIEELNQRSLKHITDEVLRCWTNIQQGEAVATATAHIENERMREAVTHIVFYVLIQSLLFDAKHRQMISSKRYEELRSHIDHMANLMKQQPFMIHPSSTV
jgi:hypothetical protein